MAGLAAFAMVLSSANAFAAGSESDSPQDYLQKTYHFKVTVQTENLTSGNLSLGPMTNAGQVDDYLRAMADECKKYPDDFFLRAGVSEIVLCGSLHMGKAPIAGIFNEQHQKLYMKFHWCRLGAHCRETFHAFHHELGHAVQNATWGDGHYDWHSWTALNPPGFKYGKGGNQELMADPEKKWGTWSTNQPGFLNAYSATAPWEDRSEIMAALMDDGDRRYLQAYYQGDPIIQKKIQLTSDLLSKLCGPNQEKYFWEKAIISLKTPPAPSLETNQSLSSIGMDLPKAIGADLIDAGGNAVSFETLKGKKYFLLYFSASWCSHCRQFMPQFLEFYQNNKHRDKFEVLFVSSDHKEPAMLSYLREMPWKAVRFNSGAESFLKTNYSRGPGIPTLALIDSEGRLLGFRKGFAKNYDRGVYKMLDILNQKLSGVDSL